MSIMDQLPIEKIRALQQREVLYQLMKSSIQNGLAKAFLWETLIVTRCIIMRDWRS